EAGQSSERRIEEMARGGREEGKRIALGERLVGDLGRRVVEGQRIDALLFEPPTIELALARGRREAALGERRKAARHAEPLPALALQRIPVQLRVERGAADAFVGVLEARLVEAQARGEPAEDLRVG